MKDHKWIFENGMWCCPFCYGAGEPNYLYCPNCGRVIDIFLDEMLLSNTGGN